MNKVTLKRSEETFVYSKTSGANLGLQPTGDGKLEISFGDLVVVVEAVVLDCPSDGPIPELLVSTNGEQ